MLINVQNQNTLWISETFSELYGDKHVDNEWAHRW